MGSEMCIRDSDKGAMSLVICEKMSGLGYICKTVVGGFEAYKGMCVIN